MVDTTRFPATVTIEEKHLDRALAVKTLENHAGGYYMPSCDCVTAEALKDAGLLKPITNDGWGHKTGRLLGLDVVVTDNASAVQTLTWHFDSGYYAACRQMLPLTFTVEVLP